MAIGTAGHPCEVLLLQLMIVARAARLAWIVAKPSQPSSQTVAIRDKTVRALGPGLDTARAIATRTGPHPAIVIAEAAA